MCRGIVLAVDDSAESLQLLRYLLVAEGYEVHTARGGEMALASCGANPPDLILLDIRMPGTDGFEVCRQLKTNPATHGIPIIFLTVATEAEERVNGLELGAVDYISKPYQRAELLARVRTHMELAKLRTDLEKSVAARTTELNAANDDLRKAARFQRIFLRDVLASVTDGVLILCHEASELPPSGAPFGAPVDLSTASALKELRAITRDIARAAGFSDSKSDDLVTAAHEGGMNSLVHAGTGTARLSLCQAEGLVRIRIEDTGPGISPEHLPKATLQKGYSTAGTLGHGMKLMLHTVDRLFLLTGSDGTTIVLEQSRDRAGVELSCVGSWDGGERILAELSG